MFRQGLLLLLAVSLFPSLAVAEDKSPLIVGHRGLMRYAPENTLAGFRGCLELRIGFELDVRRSKDGHLVVMHDASVKRTTGVDNPISEMSLAGIRKLDAGKSFAPEFAGERIPTLDDVFALIKSQRSSNSLVALDLKIDDANFAGDLAALVRKHGVHEQVFCIGLAIEDVDLRKRL